MRIERVEFRAFVDDFADAFGQRDDGRPVKPGSRLVELLGVGPVCIAIGYKDGYFARRFMLKLDARSVAESAEWTTRYKRAWLRINADSVSRPKSAAFLESVANQDPANLQELAWASVAATYDWKQVTHWGPGVPVTDWRVERLQLLFVVTRIVEESRGAHAAFSYLMGTEPRTATSPLVSIRLGGREDAESILHNAYMHTIEMGAPGGFEPAEELRQ